MSEQRSLISTIVDYYFYNPLFYLGRKVRSYFQKYKIKKIRLFQGVFAEKTIADNQSDREPLIVQTFVDPSKHTHTGNTLPLSIPAVPNTIAQRNTLGHLVSSRSSLTDSGYKILDGRDLTDLFQRTNDTYMRVELRVDGSPMIECGYGGISDASLAIEGNKIILNTKYEGWCSYGGENCYDCC